MRLALISLLIAVFSIAALGQTNKGTITGSVSDPKGLAVPGATVTVTNVATKQSVTLTTSRDGIYVANNLDPVLYEVKVEATGFKRSLIEKVKVDTASTATINVSLELGSVAEEVTIQADAITVNADSGTIVQTITERQLRDLPLNNRSVLDLAVTMPNVAGDSGSEDIDAGFSTPSPGFNLSVNGGRPGSTAMLADGVNNTGVGLARAVVSFSPETVQEFSVQSSAYSAEFGTTGGGVINITTKSGANNFFGTALWYHRNPATNARAWNQGAAPRPANNLRSNQASFTAGGPIFFPAFGEGGPRLYDGRNKSFFFVAVEPRWRNDFTQGVGLVPTAAERSGNFRGLVHTTSGWLPAAVAAQFGLVSTGADANIYQQYTVGAGSALIPIIVPAAAAGQPANLFCPFGWVPTINGQSQVSFNAQGQPYCNANQVAAQIANSANNPALNVIPTEFMDPAARALIGYMDPAGDYFLDNGLVRNLFTLRQATQNETRYTVRLDHNITEKMKATFRWTKTPAVGLRASTGSDINGNTGVYSDAEQYLGTLNWIISPSMTNEIRLNYTKGNFSEDYSPEYSIMTGRNLSSDLGIRSLTVGGMPYLTGFGNETQYAGGDIGNAVSTNNFNEEKRWDLSDTFFWTKGNMIWKIGGNVNRAQLETTPFFAASGGRWNFRRFQTNRLPTGVGAAVDGGNALASMIIGVPNVVAFRPGIFTYQYQWDSYAGFVQNDWKVKPNLTLNLGLRYSVQMPRTEKNNLQGVFRPDLAQTITYTDNGTAVTTTQRGQIALAAGIVAGAAIPDYIPRSTLQVPFAFAGRGGRSEHIVPVDWGAIEPRFGFAWSPKFRVFGFDAEKRSFVIRGGFGVSHFPINGNNRGANPDFGGFTEPGVGKPTVVGGNVSTGAQFPTQPFRLTGNNPLQGSTIPIDVLLGADSNGLVFSKAVVIPGVAVDVNDPNYGKVPYSQSWNVAIQFIPFKNSTIEIAYVGNRGVHLYTPQININARDTNTINILTANNINPTTNVADPLGRLPLLGGTTPIQVQVASLFSQYMGYEPLSKYFNANSSSIRHAGYVDFRRRVATGLSLTANYTFAKSIDDSSDASPDVRVLTTGSARGQVALGGSLEGDRAISVFDVKHAFSSTLTWDLPFGKGRSFLKDAPWYIQGPLGGWSLSSVVRIVGGNPYVPFLTDPNLLGNAFTRTVRMDIVPGVPLKNPLWDPGCRVGSAGGTNGGGCEPYINPAAFMRPPKGRLGNAPRTIDVRDPARQYYDVSIQKDFPIGKDGRRKLNFRVDALNVFNKPNFYFNNRGNQPFGWGGFPTEFNGNECIANPGAPLSTCPGAANQRASVISEAEYTTWANFNPAARPAVGTTAGQALLALIRSNANAVRLTPRPGQTGGALPDNFWSIAVPEGFATRNSLAYDISTLEGFKHWRLRNAYVGDFGSLTSGAIAFGSPSPGTSSRYIQFGVRLIF